MRAYLKRVAIQQAVFLALAGGLLIAPYAVAQIMPADPGAAGGGNPLEGLGRSDDPNPARFPQTPDATAPTDTGTAQGVIDPNTPPILPPQETTDTSQLIPTDKPDGQDSQPAAAQPREFRPVKEANTPLRKALAQMILGNYEQSLTLINAMLEKNNKDAQAHYLKAVVLVLTRHFQEARGEYESTLKLSKANSPLAQRAELGLKKLSH